MNTNKTLTIFTPTYNRKHTLVRLYESLKLQICRDFKWLIIDDGSTDGTMDLANIWIDKKELEIDYIFKENGGLYTGYNTAYSIIDTELCVCIDSDDFMPDSAVEIIINEWKRRGAEMYAGLIGLDYDAKSGMPIGGKFPKSLRECYFSDLYTRKIHIGDTKPVLRTELMRNAGPMIGYRNEKHLNPVYLMLKVCDDYPLLVVNENLCIVDYQSPCESMSANIFSQYILSPNSFCMLRQLEMKLKHNSLKNRIRVCAHYIATSIIAKNPTFIQDSPLPMLTIATLPIGLLLYFYIIIRANQYLRK